MKSTMYLEGILFHMTLIVFVSGQPQVKTQNGVLEGTYQMAPTITGATVNVSMFLGVPFAEPPIGKLRFQPPKPAKSWDGVREAKKPGHTCHQNTAAFSSEDLSYFLAYFDFSNAFVPKSENCLYLNIYSPQLNTATPKAVMIWIHGGGFTIGDAISYKGYLLAAEADVVVVTISYRLHALGFLSTDDGIIPGNMGIKDNILAIKWVKDNIAQFGGDPTSITIFGESAGASSVSILAASPVTKGLFQRAISQSGTIASNFAIRKNPRDAFLKLASKLHCKGINSVAATIECMQNAPVENITLAADALSLEGLGFAPVVDGDIIPMALKDFEKNASETQFNNFHAIDHMLGCNSNEGGLFAGLLFMPMLGMANESTPVPDTIVSMYESTILPFLVQNEFGVVSDALIASIKQLYYDWEDQSNPKKLMYQLSQLFGDATFVMPTIKLAQLHAQKSPLVTPGKTYLYYFDHETKFISSKRASWHNGADHADEMLYIWGGAVTLANGEFGEIKLTPEEIDLSRKMVTYWSNFAKTGNPNSPKLVLPMWPAYNTEKKQYLELTAKKGQDSVKSNLKQQKYEVWSKVIPSLEKQAMNPTCSAPSNQELVSDNVNSTDSCDIEIAGQKVSPDLAEDIVLGLAVATGVLLLLLLICLLVCCWGRQSASYSF